MAQAMTFYGDGFETSSIVIAFALYEIGANLEIQQKLREEVDTILAKYNGTINYDAILEMSYLDKVILGMYFINFA